MYICICLLHFIYIYIEIYLLGLAKHQAAQEPNLPQWPGLDALQVAQHAAEVRKEGAMGNSKREPQREFEGKP